MQYFMVLIAGYKEDIFYSRWKYILHKYKIIN